MVAYICLKTYFWLLLRILQTHVIIKRGWGAAQILNSLQNQIKMASLAINCFHLFKKHWLEWLVLTLFRISKLEYSLQQKCPFMSMRNHFTKSTKFPANQQVGCLLWGNNKHTYLARRSTVIKKAVPLGRGLAIALPARLTPTITPNASNSSA